MKLLRILVGIVGFFFILLRDLLVKAIDVILDNTRLPSYCRPYLQPPPPLCIQTT